MKLTFLGAAGTVTGSSYLLESNSGEQIMIDMGMFQGSHELNALNYRPITFHPENLIGAILTHAHLDHCGRLPLLHKHKFNRKIYMTGATRDLTELSLIDTAKIGKENREGALFETEDATALFPRFEIVDYHEPFQIGPFRVTFIDAGHILGSASLIIEIDGKRIVFSGDLGNTPQDLIRPTEYLDEADIVIMESTYGDRIHPEEDPFIQIQKEINAIEEVHSTLLIPSFSLERTQEILHKIDHLKRNNLVNSETPVFLDSPMAERATEIFKRFTELYNKELAEHVRRDDPFDFPGLVLIENSKQSAQIRRDSGAKVIIAGSGMMTGGRILNHAIEFLPDANNRILFVGYQAEGTVGRAILEGEKEVHIYDQRVEVRAQVAETQAMSSHADQAQLLNWLGHIKGIKTLFLTHGEDNPRAILKNKIHETSPELDIQTPHLDEVIEI